MAYILYIATRKQERNMNHQVTNIRSTVFGVFGTLNGREVEFTYSTRMWFYTDGSGYAYGAHS
jgi:hypothetical protein